MVKNISNTNKGSVASKCDVDTSTALREEEKNSPSSEDSEGTQSWVPSDDSRGKKIRAPLKQKTKLKKAEERIKAADKAERHRQALHCEALGIDHVGAKLPSRSS